MTRKHFQAIADTLREVRPEEKWSIQKLSAQWDKSVIAMAKTCRASNPRFQYDKFYTACGGLFDTEKSR